RAYNVHASSGGVVYVEGKAGNVFVMKSSVLHKCSSVESEGDGGSLWLDHKNATVFDSKIRES
ncbi:MAG: hypothetical protein V2I33_20965, partial [Kangiellaceae bacterium]|nr:hypothetical protein [Kangiellaceae bacterium]